MRMHSFSLSSHRIWLDLTDSQRVQSFLQPLMGWRLEFWWGRSLFPHCESFKKGAGRHICDYSWPSPTCPVTVCPKVFKKCRGWFPDGSWINPINVKRIFKKSSIFQMTFDYPRSSPKSPRRLPTITKQLIIFGGTCQTHPWMLHVDLWFNYEDSIDIHGLCMKNPWISLDYPWIIRRYVQIIHGSFIDTYRLS